MKRAPFRTAAAFLCGSFLTTPLHAQNVFFPANPGDMIVKGATVWTGVPGGTAGCPLLSNGPTAAPSWNCILPLNVKLPPIAPNTVWGNVTAAQAVPAAVNISQFLNTIDYDVQRPPLPGAVPYKGLDNNWHTAPPAVPGWVWTTFGAGVIPRWAPAPTTNGFSIISPAVCDGVADAAPTINSYIDNLHTAGGGVVLFPGGGAICDIYSRIDLKRGVSLIGQGAGGHQFETDDVHPTTIRWRGAAGGRMLDAGIRYNGTIQGIYFNANFTAADGLALGAPQHSIFRDLGIDFTQVGGGFAVSLDMVGQTGPSGAQYPSASLNLFDNVSANACGKKCLFMRGVVSGGVPVASITQNVFNNLLLQTSSASGANSVIECETACDTNVWLGGLFSAYGVGGTVLLLNTTADVSGFGNNFYGSAFFAQEATSYAIDTRNSAAQSTMFGGYVASTAGPTHDLVIGNGASPGKFKFVDSTRASYGDTTYPPVVGLIAGPSPYTYTNNTGSRLEFQMWAGSTTNISRSRVGPVGGVNAGLMVFDLEPNDTLTMTYSNPVDPPTIQAIPH